MEAGIIAKEVLTAGWHRSFAFFSADGSQVVGALNEWLVEVWNVGTGLPVHVFLKNALSVATWDAQFSPDGRYIASANTDGVTKLWAVKPSEPDSPLVTEVAGDGGAVTCGSHSHRPGPNWRPRQRTGQYVFGTFRIVRPRSTAPMKHCHARCQITKP